MTPRKNRLIWTAFWIGAVALALLIVRFDRAAWETRAEIRRVEQQRRAVSLAKARKAEGN
jgi:hypothetical protein